MALMQATLSTLLLALTDSKASEGRIIPWSCPVPAFGDLSRAQIATLGLNPSNREFVDNAGQELDGHRRRFHTLRSLGIHEWAAAEADHLRMIWDSCRSYFLANPYDVWFKQLDEILRDTGTSYYGLQGKACHLDLVPYATSCKWTDLTRNQRLFLLSTAGTTLGELIRDSPVKALVLNGSSVITNFQSMAELPLGREIMPDWTLGRRSGAHVAGIGYKGVISRLSGVPLGREILVIGFNHNIQSSFGVTKEVKKSIREWIGREVGKSLG